MTIPVDYTGARFGMLTGLRRVGCRKMTGTTYRPIWAWRCDCGVEVERAAANVVISTRRGSVPNCGCRTLKSKAANGRANRIHGMSQGASRRLYDVHRQMMRRCRDPACRDFPLYGARGITVCDEWRHVSAFVAWAMSSGYQPGLTIERKDNGAGYSPGNCTWIPNERQARNTRRLRLITAHGKTMFASDWSRETGINVRTIIGRLNRGWSHELAVTP